MSFFAAYSHRGFVLYWVLHPAEKSTVIVELHGRVVVMHLYGSPEKLFLVCIWVACSCPFDNFHCLLAMHIELATLCIDLVSIFRGDLAFYFLHVSFS